MDKRKDKFTIGRILRLAFVVIALLFMLTGIVISFFFSLMPENLRILPLPFVVAAIGILLVLKTTNRSLDTVVPPPQPCDDGEEEEPPEETGTGDSTTEKETDSTKEPDA